MSIKSVKDNPFAQTVPLTAASDSQLLEISRKGLLSLTLDEMKTIQSYFKKQRRDPFDVELETIAQTWSEHCKHKTFSGVIEYEEEGRGSRVYDNLLKSTIMRATQELDRPWCWSTFRDNAGVIALDDEWGVAFKVETHNHPSALEPYGGAGTGIGGVIRDILGVGLGAKPVLNTDVFAFAPADLPARKIPKGVLSPKRIINGVVAGVRDYGNRMGIPTANGAVYFDEGFVANPLVFCGTVGLLPRDKVNKEVQPGDYVVTLGGRTGRDGIHGATFSSAALEEGITSSVVQIGHAIMEKRTMDVLLQARDQGFFRAVTDCGAGGFSSAVGELGAETGVVVDLEKAPLKYQGLLPWEIWVSESQERMVLAVPPEHWPALEALCQSEGVEATVFGTFARDGRLVIRYSGDTVADMEMVFLHDGMPRVRRKAVWRSKPELKASKPLALSGSVRTQDLGKLVLKLLAHPNIASKKWVVRQYDHEVQGGSVVKPFVGFDQRGPGDACVFRPRLGSSLGVVVSNGFNPSYSDSDPYWMAACAIDEALRNLVAVGGDIRHAAILDNFCWGDPEDPTELAALVRACQACYDLSKGYGVPFISGKDSLNNTWRDTQGRLRSIPRSLLISAIGVIPDVTRAVTMDLKEPGNWVYLLGETRDELGGAHLWKVLGQPAKGIVPHVQVAQAQTLFNLLYQAIQKGYVRACHDLSEGGLAVAAAEMAFAGNLGMDLDVGRLLTAGSLSDVSLLFSETPSRFIVEVPEAARHSFEGLLRGFFSYMGQVTLAKTLVIRQADKQRVLVREPLSALRKAWEAL
ncbi:MAG: phosphoribosylformylglycinamidine synthase subunit PurL [Elusimicrobiota bacterium]|jgi:phosphoribosylformylglycinamidine synthase